MATRRGGTIRIWIWGALAWSLAAPAPLTGDPARAVRVRTSVNVDSVTVGERFRVRHTVTFPDSLMLLPPETLDPGTCRLLAIQWGKDEREGWETRTADVTALTVDLENAHLPEVPLRFLTPAGDTVTVFTDAVDVPVRKLTAEDSPPMPLKPQWQAPPDFLWVYIAAAALVLAGLAIYLWRRFRRRRELEIPPAPQLPADFVALQELERIEQMDLLAVGDFKRYYTLVVDTLRRYLERRFAIQAMDRTTYEILTDLESIGRPVEGLASLLGEADLVKFAKFVPDRTAGEHAIETARDIIVRTTPPARPEPEPAGAGTGTSGLTEG